MSKNILHITGLIFEIEIVPSLLTRKYPETNKKIGTATRKICRKYSEKTEWTCIPTTIIAQINFSAFIESICPGIGLNSFRGLLSRIILNNE